MRKIFLYSCCILSLSFIAACSSSATSTTPTTEEIDVTENTAAYSKTYSGYTVTGEPASDAEDLVVEDTERKNAYDQLQKYKEGVKDKAILNALSIVDEFYISNNTLQATRKAYNVSSENDVYRNLFAEFVENMGVDIDYSMKYQGTTYKLSEVGPKALKVNVNSLQESAAYEVVYSKFEDQKVYLHLRVPGVDSFQYYAQATYHNNYQDFFQPLEEELTIAQSEGDMDKILLVQLLYYLEAVGGEEGSVSLKGMTWGELRDIYLVFDVNKDDSISLSYEMLAAISQVDASSVNEKWEKTFQEWEEDV
ncbi:TPA: hypothetical protein ACGOVD_000568 [Streptococcus suis]